MASGDVRIVDAGSDATSPATNGQTTPSGRSARTGQMVVTGSHGRAQIRFRDGALISLQPESRFRIDQYAYGETKQRGFYSLLEGTLRAISGAIGKKNPDDFRLDTPTATIGIRGTEFLVQEIHCAPSCKPGQQDGLNVAVSHGRVLNGAGAIDLSAGRATWVASASSRPQPTTRRPVISVPPTQQQKEEEQQASEATAARSSDSGDEDTRQQSTTASDQDSTHDQGDTQASDPAESPSTDAGTQDAHAASNDGARSDGAQSSASSQHPEPQGQRLGRGLDCLQHDGPRKQRPCCTARTAQRPHPEPARRRAKQPHARASPDLVIPSRGAPPACARP